MKRLLSRLFALLTVLLLIISLVACGAHADVGDSMMGGAPAEKPSYEGTNGLLGEGNYPDNSKIIKTVRITAYTLQYDEVLERIRTAMDTLGAYTSSESHSNSRYGEHRSLTLTIKVPAEHLDELIEVLGDETDVTSLTSNVEDATLSYATLVSRRDTLTAELSSIERLFAKAEESGSLSELQSVEKRLTEVKTEINEINAKISVIDKLVAYSTVYFNLYEEVTPIEEEEKGEFARIGESFVENLKDIGNGFVEIFVFFIGGLPYFLLLGGIGVGVFFLYRRFKRRRAQSKAPKAPTSPTTPPTTPSSEEKTDESEECTPKNNDQ